ncbi:NAD(P)H-hydrate dehydratase [Campylobacter vulpis]|uniref:Bifunctional NAD(P)H-hydrate repair enzyme n=1 Tax=Campylobacter vulpis TaxID=1655500 RepID=A0ABS5P494_9BACT|nr:NAD(P)H-hydrate dehydratase [Campylobacter vulpis]MBS4241289.1 NAD(P)H-hydrate dehydratase [Campylobacter vulpis]MBS4252778.1 NAD(P)H-hydrate dehydratase [Campylobacter vulpis]MBS4282070.1 NAD(P)H-hydrate dehydratase [Campylobacter vulpis]MBS4407372.1 NAD(P)H-hydrate dehydratase [Campylobacter vulpis]
MKAVVKQSTNLDLRAVRLGLDELILMENAGIALAKLIKKERKKLQNKRVLFLLGGGNNAADGLVALRHLKKAKAYKMGFKENAMFLKQEQILKNYGFSFLKKEPKIKRYGVIVDCIFGSGFKGNLDAKTANFLKKINQHKALKIACDIPTALGSEVCFKADITLSMGAFKELLLEDFAKEFVGKLKLAKLGISHRLFTHKTKSYLLEKKDLTLIKRKAGTNKGDYGHIAVVGNGGAANLAGLGALNFGAGLVSLVKEKSNSALLMQKENLNFNFNAAALGMGLLNLELLKDENLSKKPLVLDANAFLDEAILPFLQKEDVVLTPHPKEFTRLFKMCFKQDLNVQDLQKNRFFYAQKFTQTYPCILVLKGANTIISQKDECFIVNLGCANLAKGGSGDVLAGMIAALLGAGFSPLKAAKNAVLAHALTSKAYRFNANSFDALKLIKGLKCL